MMFEGVDVYVCVFVVVILFVSEGRFRRAFVRGDRIEIVDE